MKVQLLILIFVLTSFDAFSFDAAKYFKDACTQCHTVGGGDKIGPDLAGLSKRRDVKWATKFVNYPDGFINGDAEEPGYEKADPIAKKVYELYKPQMMTENEITEEQMKAIFVWIDSQNKKPKGKITQMINPDGTAKK
jgi:protein SCO1/2